MLRWLIFPYFAPDLGRTLKSIDGGSKIGWCLSSAGLGDGRGIIALHINGALKERCDAFFNCKLKSKYYSP
jgi:hypothetical protein